MIKKLIPKLEYPVLERQENVLCNRDHEKWAYFSINTQVLKLNDVNAENKFVERLSDFVEQINLDTHYVMLPKGLDIAQKNEIFKKEFDGAFKDIGFSYIDRATEILEYELQDAVEYLFFIGVKLPKLNRGAAGILKDTKKAFSIFNSTLSKVVALQEKQMTEEEEYHYEKAEEEVYALLKSKISCRRATKEEMDYLEAQAFVRGQSAPVTKGSLESIINVRRAGYVKLTQLEEESWCAFLPAVEVPIDMTYSRWLFIIQQLPFSVETHIRADYKSLDDDRTEAIRAKRKFKDQDNQLAEINEDEDSLVNDGRVILAELENKIKNEKKHLIRTNIVFVVSDKTKEGLDSKIRSLTQVCKDMDIKVIQPIADQLHLFHQCLIGSRVLIRDWEQQFSSEALAESLFGLSQKVGNTIGFYIGKNISDGSSVKTSLKPVFFHPQLGNQRIAGAKTRSLHFMVTGPTGMGKSYLTKNILLFSTFLGAQILGIDPKNEYERDFRQALKYFPKEEYPEFHEMIDKINFISLSHDEKDRGKLDPLRFLEGVEAEDTAINLLESLAKVQDTERQISNAITEAVQKVVRADAPGLLKVVEVLKSDKNEPTQEVGKQLESYSKSSLGMLLFSDGHSESISLEKQFNVIQIQNLDLPKAEMDARTYNRSHHLSVCTMIPLAKFTTKFLRNEIEGVLKLALFEEAWALENTTQGTALIKEMLRTGRSLNCGCGIVTQSAKDYNDQDVKEQVGVRFAFRAEDEREQEDVLKFFDLPVNEENRALLSNLEEGECLFRDIYGRTAKIAVDVLYDEWIRAFNTVEETKAREVAI